MALDYPEIIASTVTPIRMTHNVRYRTALSWRRSNWSDTKITAMKFDTEHPSTFDVISTLRKQLGYGDNIDIDIISVGPFTGYTAKP